jgi:hypothetical protein
MFYRNWHHNDEIFFPGSESIFSGSEDAADVETSRRRRHGGGRLEQCVHDFNGEQRF